VDAVYIVFSEFKNVISAGLAVEKLLPVKQLLTKKKVRRSGDVAGRLYLRAAGATITGALAAALR